MAHARKRDVTIIRPAPQPNARRSLVCLGFCGGGTGPYLPWVTAIPEHTELVLICYPGREGRFTEKLATSWDELAEDATDAVLAASERRYILCGHSMGGWMACDVAHRIGKGGGRPPDALIASSCNCPTRGVTERDRFPRPDDTDEELVAWMQDVGLLPDYVRTDPELRQMSIDLMRADLLVRDSFRPVRELPDGLPVQVLYGGSDHVIDPGAPAQWAELTRGTCRIDVLPGRHFYVPEVWRTLPAYFAVLRHEPPSG